MRIRIRFILGLVFAALLFASFCKADTLVTYSFSGTLNIQGMDGPFPSLPTVNGQFTVDTTTDTPDTFYTISSWSLAISNSPVTYTNNSGSLYGVTPISLFCVAPAGEFFPSSGAYVVYFSAAGIADGTLDEPGDALDLQLVFDPTQVSGNILDNANNYGSFIDGSDNDDGAITNLVITQTVTSSLATSTPELSTSIYLSIGAFGLFLLGLRKREA
jgi:hypothetical protein